VWLPPFRIASFMSFSTTSTPTSDRWLKQHPNVHFHFTPTRSSWLNQIKTWFSILPGQSLTGSSFTLVQELQEHIDSFIAAYNETATPFAWTKKKVYQRRSKSPYL
jgi:hypothetical protein